MLQRKRVPFICILSTILFVACAADEIVGPETLEDVVLAYCPNSAPLWGAFRNEGADWKRLEFDGSGRTEFAATPRVALALVFREKLSFASTVRFLTTVAYTTPARIGQSLPSCAVSQKVLSGAVTGLSAGQSARVSLGTRGASTKGAFTLTAVRDGPLDLLALRYTEGDGSPDRIITRRSLNPTHGSTLPTLDFASPEAVAVTTNALTVAGLQSGESGSIDQDFISATTFLHLFTRFDLPATSIAYAVPAARMTAGDYHRLTVSTSDAGFSQQRQVVRYYVTPDEQVVALGRPLAQPTITVRSTAPNQLLRMDLPSQVEYATHVTAYYWQDTERAVEVSANADHLGGTPSSWILDIPDLSAVPGWQAGWGLAPSVSVKWAVVGIGGDEVREDAIPSSGATTRLALRLAEPPFPGVQASARATGQALVPGVMR